MQGRGRLTRRARFSVSPEMGEGKGERVTTTSPALSGPSSSTHGGKGRSKLASPASTAAQACPSPSAARIRWPLAAAPTWGEGAQLRGLCLGAGLEGAGTREHCRSQGLASQSLRQGKGPGVGPALRYLGSVCGRARGIFPGASPRRTFLPRVGKSRLLCQGGRRASTR